MIPVNEPLLGQRELEYVTECIRTGWISSAGKFIERFENDWAARCGRRYGIAVSNGTVALQLAVATINLRPGDEIIMPTFTIISCPLAAIYNECVPVLVDCDPDTWCMNVSQIQEKISSRTRAIMPVHIYGHPVEMDPVFRLADEYGLAVIEDAAEAHGAQYLSSSNPDREGWLPCGGMGDVSAFSFYANKLVTTGEGGMVLTDDEGIAERARSLRNLAFQSGRRFYHESMGYNFRMTNVQAALGVAQIERFDEIVVMKRSMARLYHELLGDVSLLKLPEERPWARNVYWMYGVLLRNEAPFDAFEFARRLRARGIDTRPFFIGMHEQPALRRLGLFENESYPVTERISQNGLYLPSGLAITEEEILRVSNGVKEALAE